MKFLMNLVVGISLLGVSALSAAEKFDYRKVIAPPIKAMGTPKLWKGVGELKILVSSENEKAEAHVKQGFALLHAQWDLEAYRHFAAALKNDDQCLLAYCGVVLSMLNPEHEWKGYRNVALNRMVTLCEHKQMFGKKGEPGAAMIYTFPNNERGFAIAIAQLMTEGYAKGAGSIVKLADMFPDDIQFALMAPFLNRGSYDVFGHPNIAQESAVKEVRGIMDENPENPLTINFYIMMLIEAPYNAVDQKTHVLPYARKIVEISGGELPPWHMLHGYAAWRSGELTEAKSAFQKAITLYEKWKKETKANLSECDGLMRAYSFLAVINHELKDQSGVDRILARMELAKHTRKSSGSYAMYEWNQQLLRSKMLFAKGATGDRNAVDKAIKALPKIKSTDKNLNHLNKVIKGYQAYGLALQNFQRGKINESLQMASLLGKIINEIKGMAQEASKKAYYPHFLMSLKTLSVYHNELAAMREEKSGVGAVNWYSEAIDLQLGASRLFPPNILYPIEYRLGRYHESRNELGKALNAYAKGHKRMASHQETKLAYERVHAQVQKIFEDEKKRVAELKAAELKAVAEMEAEAALKAVEKEAAEKAVEEKIEQP